MSQFCKNAAPCWAGGELPLVLTRSPLLSVFVAFQHQETSVCRVNGALKEDYSSCKRSQTNSSIHGNRPLAHHTVPSCLTGPDWKEGQMAVEGFQYHSSNFGPAPKSNLFISLWSTTNQHTQTSTPPPRHPRVTRLHCTAAHPLL